MAKIDAGKLLPQSNKSWIVAKTGKVNFSVPKYTKVADRNFKTEKTVNEDNEEILFKKKHDREVKKIEGLVDNISTLLMSRKIFAQKKERKEKIDAISKKRKEKESELEAKKSENGFDGPKLVRKVVGGGLIDSIWRFFLYTFLGAILNRTKDIIPGLLKVVGFVAGGAWKVLETIFGALFEGFVFFVDLGFKIHDTIRGTVQFLGGDTGVKIFDAFTSGLSTFLNTALIVGMTLASMGMMPDFGLGGGGKGKRGAAPGSTPGRRPPAPGARPGSPSTRPPAPGTRPGVGARPGGPSARPGANPVRGMPRPPAPGATQGFRTAAGFAGQGAAKGVAKGASRVGSKFVPFIGPIIDFAIRTLVFGDSPGRAAAGAAGVAAGQALGGFLGGTIGTIAGSVVPIIGNLLAGGAGALIGSVIGGFIGDAIGTTLYDMVFERSKTTKPKGRASGGRVSRPVKPITRRSKRLKVPAESKQKQKTEAGRDIGGKSVIQRLFPDTDTVGGDGGNRPVGLIGWAKSILGFAKGEEEGKGGIGNPFKALTETSEILKGIPIVGGIMGASIDIALGQKPSDLVYAQLGASIGAIIKASANRAASESLYKTISAFAAGGVVKPSETSTFADDGKLEETLSNSFKRMIGLEAQTAIRNISGESKRRRGPAKRGSPEEATETWGEGETGAPGAAGTPGAPGAAGGGWEPAGGGMGGRRGTRGAKAKPGTPKVPGVPGVTPAPGDVGSGGNISVTMTPNQKKALDILSKYESAGSGGYSAVNQIGIAGGRGVKGYSGDFSKMKQHGGRKLTDLTVGEVLALQAEKPGMSDAEWIKQGRLHAVGRYQFIGNTLPGVVRRAGIPRDAKFSKEVQDLLALQYMKERGIGAWIGPSDKATAEERRIIEAARQDPIKFAKAEGKAGAPPTGTTPKGKPLGSIYQHLHGDPNRPGYDYGGHGTEGNAHDHFSFSNRQTAIAAYKALKARGYDVTEFEGFGGVGSHSARGGHFGKAGGDPTYNDASDGVAFDVPWYQFGSGAIGERDFKKSREVEAIVKQAITGQITTADGKTQVWDSKSQSWVAGTPGNASAGQSQRKVGQEATLNGKPVVWNGTNWAPKRDSGGNILTKIQQTLFPQKPAAHPAGGGMGGKRGSGSSPSTPSAKPAAKPTTKPAAPKAGPAAKGYGGGDSSAKKPQRAWYDPRGWIGKEEGGQINPVGTPPRKDFTPLQSHASYEKTGQSLMIQPIIVQRVVPVPLNQGGTTDFGPQSAGGVNSHSGNRNSLSRH
jgi:hypothetical protein